MKLPEAIHEFRPHSKVWDTLLTLLPPGPELERWARTTGALCRKRGVNGAQQLLRVALCYGFCNLSLEVAAAWAGASQSATLGKTALLRRLRKCGPWLEHLIAQMLAQRLPPLPLVKGLRVQLVDATRLACPGSKGHSWRVHAAYDPWECRLMQLSLTDNTGGERLDRFRAQKNDLLVGDRGYAHRRGLAHVRSEDGHFLIRTGWNRVPLQQPDGQLFDLFGGLATIPDSGVAEFAVRTEPDERNGIPAVACRLVVLKKSAEQAADARAKVKATAKKQKNKLDPRTVEAAGYVLVLTSVEADKLNAHKVMELYRLRWQIELAFKRMKSILAVNVIRAREPQLVRTVIAAKILASLLVENLVAGRAKGQVFRRKQWSLTHLGAHIVQNAIFGQEAIEQWLADTMLDRLDLTDIHRKRQPQCLTIAASLA